MDLRRTAKREKVWFGVGSDTQGSIQWYEAPPGAKWWTSETVFRSNDWWDGKPPFPERPGVFARSVGSYSKGNPIPGYTGQTFCGRLEWYRDGIPSPPPENPNTRPDGVPECCVPDRFGAFDFNAASSMEWVSGQEVFRVRQVTFSRAVGLTIPIYWQVPTLTGSFLVVWTATYGHPLPSLTPPVGYQTLGAAEFVRDGGTVFAYTNAPSYNALSPSPPLYDGGTIQVEASGQWDGVVIAWEVEGANRSEPIAAFSGVATGSTTNETGTWATARIVLTPPVAEQALDISLYGVSSDVRPVNVHYLVAGSLITGGGAHFQHVPFPPLVRFTFPWLAAYAQFGLAVRPAWVYVPPRFVFSAVPDMAWVGVGEGPFVFTFAAAADQQWAGAAEAAGAFDFSALADQQWAGAAEGAGAFDFSALADQQWAGAALGAGAFDFSAAAAASWSGAALGAGAFVFSAAAAASWSGAVCGARDIQHTTKTTSAGTTISQNWGTATTAGNLLIAVIGTRVAGGGIGSAPTVTAPAGWSQAATVLAGGSTTTRLYIFYKENAASQSSTGNFSASASADMALVIAEIQGAITSGSLDKTATNSGNSSSPSTGTTATTSQAAELLIGAVSSRSGSALSAPTNSFVIEDNASAPPRVGLLYRVVQATGAYSTGCTAGSDVWGGAIATFKLTC